MADIERADAALPEGNGVQPHLHWQGFRMRFVDGKPFIENTDTGTCCPFPLAVAPNFIIRGREDGREYLVQLEGAEVMVSLTVLHWDPEEGARLAEELRP